MVNPALVPAIVPPVLPKNTDLTPNADIGNARASRTTQSKRLIGKILR
jgi:hypothetical protein